MNEDAVADIFAPFGPVTTRRMFGGIGVYSDGVMIALVAFDELFIKTDSESVAVMEAEGSSPFVYEGGAKSITMSYWRMPERAFEDDEALIAFATMAKEAALRAKAKAPPKRKKKPPKD